MSHPLQVPRAPRSPRVPARLRPAALPAALSAALAGMAPGAFGLPEGAAVVQGQAAVQQTGANRLDIRQTTSRATIDWTRFSIGASEQVVVSQPGRTAVLVNRVLGDDPSQIFGSLRANGTVWLVNPRGIVFGRDSSVDVGGLLASTLIIRDEDLASGRLLLSRAPGGAGALRAEGRISAPDGSVALVAPSLLQSGRIDARRIGLAAATQVEVDVEGDGLIFFNARNDGSLDTRLQQLGTLRADAGLVELRAAARAGFADTVLNMDGIVEARSIGRRGGQIVIDGGNAGQTWITGRLDASGSGADARGGQVTVLGDRIGVAGSARLDATGDAGGGAIRVGGDYQGANPALRNASAVLVQAGAVLDASAGQAGDGGLVVTWSDKATQFLGAANARGGARSGDGGLVEVSSKGHLDFRGTSDRSAPAGRTGTLLLDPDTLEIVDKDPDIDGTVSTATLDLATNKLEAGTYAGAASRITAGQVAEQLKTGDVELQASDALTVSKDVTSTSTQALILQGGNRVTVNAAIGTGGAITLKTTEAGGAVTTTADVTAGGVLTITGTGGTHALSGKLTGASLAITGGITIGSGLTLTLAPTTGVSQIGAAIAGDGNLAKAGAGTLTLAGDNTYTGSTSIDAGTLALGSVNALGGGGTIVFGGGTLQFSAANTADLSARFSTADNQPIRLDTNGQDVTLASAIAGTGTRLAKLGAGTLTLDAANVYTGATTVQGGTLKLGATGTLASQSSLVIDGGTFDLGGSLQTVDGVQLAGGSITNGTLRSTTTFDLRAGTITAVLDGAVGAEKSTAGTVTLGNHNTYTGATQVKEGVLQLAHAQALGVSALEIDNTNGASVKLLADTAVRSLAGGGATGGGLDLDSHTLNVTGDGTTTTFAGRIEGSGGLRKAGTGSLTLSGDNTYTGSTAIDGGTLALGSAKALGDGGAITFGGGTLQFSAANTTDYSARFSAAGNQATRLDTNGHDVTLASAITGAGTSLAKLGDGTLTLNAANGYTGATTVQGGTLALGVAGALADGGSVQVNGGTLDLGGFTTKPDTVQLLAGSIIHGTLQSTHDIAVQAGDIGAKLVGDAGVVKTGSGKVTLSGDNTYTGSTAIDGGTLALGSATALGNGGAIMFGGGTLQFSAANTADYSARFSTAGNQPIRLDTNGQDVTLASAITGTGTSLAKLGGGTLTLDAANGYTGATTVQGGTLKLGPAGTLASASSLVVDGGTFDLGGATQTVASVQLAGGTIANGTLRSTTTFDLRAGTVTAVLDGSVGSEKSTAGTVTLGSHNTYTGATQVKEGVLQLAHAKALGVSALEIDNTVAASVQLLADTAVRSLAGGGSVDLNGHTLDVAGDGTATVYAGGFSGAGSSRLRKSGTGSLTLDGTSTHTGTTEVSGGTLALGAGGVLAEAGTLEVSAGTFDLGARTQTLEGVLLTGGTIAQGTLRSGTPFDLRAGTVTAVLDGAVGLEKSGSGTVTLGSHNTYTGPTRVKAGMLELAHAQALGPSALVLDNAAGASVRLVADTAVRSLAGGGDLGGGVDLNGHTLEVAGNGTATAYAGVLSGSGSSGLRKSGTGSLTLDGVSTYTGSTTVAAGALALGAAGALATSSTLVVTGGSFDLGTRTQTVAGVQLANGAITNGTLESTATFDLQAGTVSAVLAGAVGMEKTGSGTVTLTHQNTYTGTTRVQQGVLELGHAQALGASALVTDDTGGAAVKLAVDTTVRSLAGGGSQGGGVDLGSHTLSVAGDGTATTFAGRIAGSGGLRKAGTGSLVLAGANTYTGGTAIDGGTLTLGSVKALGTVGSIAFGGGTLQFSAANTQDHSARFSHADGQAIRLHTNGQDVTLASAITGAGSSLVKLGAGTLTLSGANTYTGGTAIDGGTLALGSAQALGSGGSIAFGGGTLQFSAANTQDYSARFSHADSQAIRLDTHGQSVTLASAITGAGSSLVKRGAGTLTLAAANGYTGSTTVEGGTLQLGAAGTLANASSLEVEGGIVDLGNTLQAIDSVQLAGGSIINGTLRSSTPFDLRAGTVTAVLDGAVGLDKTGTGTVTLGNHNTYTGPTRVQGGVLELGHAQALGASALVTDDTAGAAVRLLVDTAVRSLAGGGASGGGVDLDGHTLAVAGDGTATVFAGALGGGGSSGLSKSGSGSLTLRGANTYTGTTTVSGGTLALDAGGSLAEAGRLVVSGGTFDLGGQAQALAGVQLAAGAITQGTLRSGSTFDLQSGTVAAVLDGAVGAEKTGGGTVTLSNQNTYTGTTLVRAGLLQLGHAQALGASALVTENQTGASVRLLADSTVRSLAGGGAAGGWVDLDGHTLQVAGDGTATAYAGTLGGGAGSGLHKSGTGRLTLDGASTFTGTTTVSGGTLALGASDRLHADSRLVVSGGTFDLGGASQTVAGVTLAAGAITHGTLTSISAFDLRAGAVDAVLAGNVGLDKSGGGTVTLAAQNSHTGTTRVQDGVLQLAHAHALGSSALVTDNAAGAAVRLLADTAVRSLAGGGASGGGVDLHGHTLDVTGDATATVYAGALGGGGGSGLRKSGTGSLRLDGIGTYTGSTEVSGGTLALGPGGALDAGSRLVVNGGTFDLGGTTQTLAGVTLAAGTITHGTLASTTAFDLQAGMVDAALAGGAGLVKTGAGTVTLAGSNGFSGSAWVQQGVLELAHPNALGASALVLDDTAGASARLLTDSAVLALAGGGASGGWVDLRGHTLAVQGDGAVTSYSGRLSSSVGDGSLLKSGTGSLTLVGASTYTGTTTVSGGTLALGPGGALAEGSRLVVDGGTFDLGGGVQMLDGVRMTGGAITQGTLIGTQTFDLQGGLVTAVLGGNVGLDKTGSGTLTLASGNTYTGATRVQGGVLELAHAAALGASALVTEDNPGAVVRLQVDTTVRSLAGGGVTGGGVDLNGRTLAVAGDGTATVFAGVLAGGSSAGLLKSGSGSLTLAGSNSFTGTTTVDGGTLVLGASERLHDDSRLVVSGGTVDLGGAHETLAAVTLAGGAITHGTLTSTSAFDMRFGLVDAELAGTAGLTKSGAGPVWLTAQNTYTGTTTVLDGTLVLGTDQALASGGALSVQGGTLDLGGFKLQLAGVQQTGGTIANGTLRSDTPFDMRAGLVDAELAGTVGLTKSGAGVLMLQGANSYTGATTVVDGSLRLLGPQRLSAGGTLVVDGGAVQLGGNSQVLAGVQQNGGLITDGTLTSLSPFDMRGGQVQATLDGTAGLVKSGPGTLTLLALNTYTGVTTVADGVLQLTGHQLLAQPGQLVVSGGVLDLGGATQVLSGVQQTGGAIANGALFSLGTFDLRAGTVDAVLGGTAGLSKTGAGTVLLNAANTYSGTTTVDGGLLQLGGHQRLAAGTQLVVQDGTLDLGGHTQVVAAVRQTGGLIANGTLQSGSDFDMRAGTATADLTGQVALVKQGPGSLTLGGANTYAGATQLVAGVLELGGDQRLPGAGQLQVQGGTLDLGGHQQTLAAVQQTGGRIANGTLASQTAFDLQAGTVDAVLAGSAGLAKTGGGTVTLHGANTYTGTTTVAGGALVLGADQRLAVGGRLAMQGGMLDLGGHAQTLDQVQLTAGLIAHGTLTSLTPFDLQAGTVDAVLGGSAGLTKTTGGTVTLNGANTYTGTTTVADGALVLGGDQRLAAAGQLLVQGGTLDLGGFTQTLAGVQQRGGVIAHGTLTSQSAFDLRAGTVDAVLAGSAGLTKTTGGTVVLNGANTYAGTTTVADGTLALGGDDRLATGGQLLVQGGTLDLGGHAQTLAGVQQRGGVIANGTLTSQSAFDLRAGTVDAVLAGSAGLTKSTGGTVTLNGANTYTGTTTVDGGTLVLGGDQRLAAGGQLLVQGGNLDLGGFTQTLAGVQQGGGVIANGTLTSLTAFDLQAGTVDAVLSGTAGLTKTTGGTVTLNGANTYTGTTTVDGGTLLLGGDQRLALGGQLVVQGGKLDLGGFTQTLAGVQQRGGVIANGTLTSLTPFDLQAGTVDAVLAGSAGLTKTTTGTVTLNGANTYTGATTVDGGTLVLGADQRLAAGGQLVVQGGTLDLGGFTQTLGQVQMTAGLIAHGTLTSLTPFDLQAGTVDAVLAGSAGLTKSTGGTVTLTAANTYTGPTTVDAGLLQLQQGNDRLATWGWLDLRGGTLDLGGAAQSLFAVRQTGGTLTNGTLASATPFEMHAGLADAVLAGPAGLLKQGPGSLTLGGANSYAGATQLVGGTLLLAGDDRLPGAGQLQVQGGTLDLGGHQQTLAAVQQTGGRIANGTLASQTAFDLQAGTVDAVLAGSAGLAKTGGGTVTLNGANTYTGTTTVAGGALVLGADQRLAAGGRLAVQGGMLDLGGHAQTLDQVQLTAGLITHGTLTGLTPFDLQAGTVDAVLGGTAGLTKTTGGTVTLNGANTYTGTTTVADGTLVLGADQRLAAAGQLLVQGGTLDLGGHLQSLAGVQQRGGVIANGTLGSLSAFDLRAGTVDAVLAGSAGLTKTTGGTVALNGANTYTGTTTVAGGTLVLGADQRLATAGQLLVAGGTLDLGGFTQTLAGVQQTGGLVTHGTLGSQSAFDLRAGTVDAVLAGSAGLTKTTGGTVTLNGANTYTGTTTVAGGTLVLGGDQRLDMAGQLLVQGGTLDLGGFTQTLAGVQQSSGLIANGTLGSLSAFDLQAGQVDAVLAGQVGLDKGGAGTVTLTAANSYTGPTRVFDGVLVLQGANRLAPGGRLDMGGGTLDLGGFTQTLSGVQQTGGVIANGTLTSTSAFDLQAGTVDAVLAGSAGLTKTTGGTVTLNGANTYTGTTTVDGGTLLLGGDQRLDAAGQLVVRGGTLDLGGHAQTLSQAQMTAGLIAHGTLTSLTAFDLQAGTADAVLAGSAGLTKTGAGLVTLNGASTSTGTTTVDGGTLLLGGDQRLDAAAQLVVRGGTLDLGGHTQTLDRVQQTGGVITHGTLASLQDFDLRAGTADAVLAGAAGLAKAGAGVLALGGANTYAGDTTVADGTLQLGAAPSLPGAGRLVVQGGTVEIGAAGQTVAVVAQTGGRITGGPLTATGSFDLQAGTVDVVLAGPAGLSKTGPGTVGLTAANTYTGTTQVTDGVLLLQGTNRLATTGRLELGGGTLDLGGASQTLAALQQTGGRIAHGTLASTSAFDMRAGVVDAVLAGSAGLTKTTGGTLTLNGANTYTGATTLAGGTLLLGADQRLAVDGRLVLQGGTLDLGGKTQMLDRVQQTGGLATHGTLASRHDFDMQAGTAAATLAGTVGLAKTGGGTFVLSGAAGYTGTTTVTQGTLQLGAADRLPAANHLVVQGGTLDLGGFTQTLAGVQQSGGAISHGTLTSTSAFDVQAGTVDAVLAGSAGLAKTGTGTLTLQAANLYTGTTTVSDGVLRLAGHDRLAQQGALRVTGGSLDLGGFGQTLAAVQQAGGAITHGTLTSTSAFDMRSGAVDAVLAGSAGLTKSGSGTLTLSGANTYTGTTTVDGGTLLLGGAQRLAGAGQLVVQGGSVDLGGFTQTLAGVQQSGGSLTHGTLTSTSAFDLQAGTVDAVLAGGAGLVKSTDGTVALNAANTYTGTTRVDGGTLRLGGAQRLAGSGQLLMQDGTLDLGGATQTLAGVRQTGGRITHGTLGSASAFAMEAGQVDAVLAGSAGLDKTTSGTVVLGGANTYTGTTTVAGGLLVLDGDQRLAVDSRLVVQGGALDLGSLAQTVDRVQQTGGVIANGTLTSRSTFDLQAGTVSAVLAGAVGLGKTTDGTVTLTAANTYTGPTTVAGGVLLLQGDNRLAPGGRLAISGGTADLGGAAQRLGAVQQTGGVIANGTLRSDTTFDLQAGVVDARLAGTAGLAKSGPGTVTLNGANTYTGTTTVLAGTLRLGGDQRLAIDGRLVVQGGTLDLGTHAQTLSGVQQTGGVVANGTLTSTSAFDLQAGTVDAVLAGSAGLTKTAAGTVTLNGANTVTGDTTVQGGTLRLGADERLADASRLVVSGGTLDLGGFAETVAGVRLDGGSIAHGTLTSTSHFDLRSGSASAVLAGTVGMDKTTDGTVTLAGDNTARGPVTVTGGTLRLAASERLSDAVQLVVGGGTLDLGGFTETVDAVRQTGGTIAHGLLVSSTGFDLLAGSIGASLHSPQGLRKTGDGTLAITAGDIDPTTLTLDGGTLTVAPTGATLQGALVVDAGTLDLGGGTQSVAGLQQNGGLVRNGTLASASTFDLRAGTISAVLAGDQGLRKSTDGTTVLRGANVYSGLTQVDAGVLHLDGPQRLAAGGDANIAASRARVAEGAVLLLNGPQVLFQVQMDGQLTGTGQLDTIGARSTSGRFDLPLTADLLDVSGLTQINADATVTRLRVADGGQLEVGAAAQLHATDRLDVAGAGRVTLHSAQTVTTLNLAGTLDGTGLLTATTYALQGGQVLAPLAGGTLTSSGSSLLNAPAAVDRITVQGGTLRTGANGPFTARPAVQVDAGATLALGRDAVIGRLAGAGDVQLDRFSLQTGSLGDSRFDGALSGSGSLVKEGSSRFELGGANSFTGGTVVRAGQLALRGDERLADGGTVQVDAGATLRLDGTETVAALALAGTLDGSGTLAAARYALQGGRTQAGVALGAGALTSDGDSRLGGPVAVERIDVDSGTLTLAAGSTRALPATRVAADAVLALDGDNTLGSLSGAGRVALGSATLTTGAAGSSRFGGTIGGSGGLVKQGDGRFTLAGDNTYTGPTTVTAGTLALAGPADGPADSAVGAVGEATIAALAQAVPAGQRLSDATAVTVLPVATLQLAGDQTVATLLLQGTLAGSGTLAAATYRLDGGTALADLGAGALTSVGGSVLAGRSAAGTVDVQAGQLRLAAADRLADGAAVTVAPAARLTLAGDDHVDRLALRGTLDGSGTLRTRATTLDGGQVLANLAADVLDSRGASRLQGVATADALNVLDGTLTLATAQQLPALPAVTVAAGAQLALQGDQTLGSLAGAGAVDLGSFTLATGARADSTFAGAIGGSGGLVKQGSATTFALTGASTYTGSTQVAAGTLAIGDGGSSGSLATSSFVVDGVLQVRRAGTVRLDQPVSGSGSIEQAGPAADSTLVLRGSNKTQTGPTRVRSGRLVTEGDEALSDAGALVVDAGAALVLGGAETVASVDAAGTVDVASRLSATGDLTVGGALRAAGSTPLLLEAASITATNAGNRLGDNLALRTPGSVQLSAGSDGNGRLPLTLGDVQVGGGGRIEASTMALNGQISLRGATLVLDVDRGEVVVEPTGDLLGKLTPGGRQIALTQDVLTQGAAGRITTDDGGGLRIDASRGGSVALLADTNRFEGEGLAVVVGAAGQAWKPNLVPRSGGTELSVQNQVRVRGTQVDVGGAGIQADLVTLRAGGVGTLGTAAIVAKLPYDNQTGTTQSVPALTFDLTELAFATPGSYGTSAAGIRINVGSRLFGDRSVLPLDAGYVAVLPANGARGGTAVLLSGPQVASNGYSFFYSGAGQQGQIPVFYNGVTALTPQVSGSISATLSVSEGARKERFDDAVRVENVALRLRAGVIAEVGPGRPATVNTGPMDGLRPPTCAAVPGGLLCN